MLTTYNLSDGTHITGDDDDVELMITGERPMSETDWGAVRKAISNGKIVINMAHVIDMRKPFEHEVTRYEALGY